MTTLFDITLWLAAECGDCQIGAATSGSATALVDTLADDWPDDHFNRGTLFFRSGANAGKTAIITDWAVSTHQFSFAAQTSAVAAADLYTACSASYNRQMLRNGVNQALKDMGRVMKIDKTLPIVSGQTSYTLPAGVSDVRRVSANDSGLEIVSHFWREVDGTLYFDKEPTGDTLWIYYPGWPDDLDADSDTIPTGVPLDYLRWSAAEAVYRARLVMDSSVKDRLAMARENKLRCSLRGARLMAYDVKVNAW